MMLEHKLKVQRDLLNEGFRKKSEEMNEEIRQLKYRIETTENSPSFLQVLERFGSEIVSIFTSPGRIIGTIIKGVSSLFKKN